MTSNDKMKGALGRSTTKYTATGNTNQLFSTYTNQDLSRHVIETGYLDQGRMMKLEPSAYVTSITHPFHLQMTTSPGATTAWIPLVRLYIRSYHPDHSLYTIDIMDYKRILSSNLVLGSSYGVTLSLKYQWHQPIFLHHQQISGAVRFWKKNAWRTQYQLQDAHAQAISTLNQYNGQDIPIISQSLVYQTMI